MRFVCILLTVLLGGCTTVGLPEMMEKIGKDPATLCSKLIYGPAVVTIYRTNITATGGYKKLKVVCKDEGLELEAEPNGLVPQN